MPPPVQCVTQWNLPCHVCAFQNGYIFDKYTNTSVVFGLQNVIEIKDAHVFLWTLWPYTSRRALWTSKHHWSAEWGGGDTVILQCLLSAEGRENTLLRCCACLHHSLYVHSPSFTSSHLLQSLHVCFSGFFFLTRLMWGQNNHISLSQTLDAPHISPRESISVRWN